MCEIALCVRDMGATGNLAIDCKAPKQGDVIEVMPDGFGWGRCDLGVVVPGNPNGNHPFMRIIKLPNVTVAQASNLMTPELDTDPQHPSPYLQYRARFLDKSKINQVAAKVLWDHWNDDARTAGFITLPYSAAQLQAIVTVRTPIPFP